MDENLSPLERTCKMIGEKYGLEARELLMKIKERKERDRLSQINPSVNKTIDKSIDDSI